MFWIGFLVGVIIGVFIGFVTCALFSTSKHEEQMERLMRDYNRAMDELDNLRERADELKKDLE